MPTALDTSEVTTLVEYKYVHTARDDDKVAEIMSQHHKDGWDYVGYILRAGEGIELVFSRTVNERHGLKWFTLPQKN